MLLILYKALFSDSLGQLSLMVFPYKMTMSLLFCIIYTVNFNKQDFCYC